MCTAVDCLLDSDNPVENHSHTPLNLAYPHTSPCRCRANPTNLTFP